MVGKICLMGPKRPAGTQLNPQSISVSFKKPVDLESVEMVFQGGFAGKSCQFLVVQATSKKTNLDKDNDDDDNDDDNDDDDDDDDGDDDNDSDNDNDNDNDNDSKKEVVIDTFEAENTNNLQTFQARAIQIVKFTIVFKESYDFFGRIILYKLDLIGKQTALL